MPRKRTSERTVPRSLMVKVFGCRLTQAVRLDWGRRTETAHVDRSLDRYRLPIADIARNDCIGSDGAGTVEYGSTTNSSCIELQRCLFHNRRLAEFASIMPSILNTFIQTSVMI